MMMYHGNIHYLTNSGGRTARVGVMAINGDDAAEKLHEWGVETIKIYPDIRSFTITDIMPPTTDDSCMKVEDIIGGVQDEAEKEDKSIQSAQAQKEEGDIISAGAEIEGSDRVSQERDRPNPLKGMFKDFRKKGK